MAPKHGPPLGTSGKKTFIEVKSTTYRNNCASGFVGYPYNAHHVIPCTSLKASLNTYLDGKDPEYRLALAFFTNWDVNAEPNMLGLPVHESYRLVFNSMKRRGINVGRPSWVSRGWAHVKTPKYPIHIPASTWGHDTYNEDVEVALDQVWTKLKVKHKKHKPFEATDLGSEIQAVSNTYRGKLVAKTGQTLEDWQAHKYAKFKMA